jgi:adenylosuccinate lyase|tara:strand:+ start:3973 stop:5265 length:1293 start_codon:yes stop_codon:yes gene_type:complete
MIPRYSRAPMTEIWSDTTKYNIWLDIELFACEAMEQLGTVPKGTSKKIRSKAKINPARIDKIEREVKHDVIAFLTSIAEYAGPPARFLHQGLTSSDVLDTAFNVQLSRSSTLILKEVDLLLKALKKIALKHKHTPCVGRSHGIHAEPTTFGIKMASFYEEFKRNKARLILAQTEINICAISGAVGNYANIDPKVEKYVAKKLKFKPESVSTQVIPRDRHAVYFSTLALLASSIERLATEIRHLQRTEVLEVEEFFSKGQKGSSAMPHKRNPVLSENLTGLARLVRGYALPALENVVLWHERDISHSSVERIMAPDANIAMDFSLARMTNVISNLIVYPKNMEANLNKLKGLPMSEGLMLALTQKGLAREKAYRMIQKNAMIVWQTQQDFVEVLLKDNDLKKYLSETEIKKILNLDHALRRTNQIFKKVFQ